jgi:hypothetical protein
MVGGPITYMKKITLSLFCLSLFTLSAVAQDTPDADNTRKNEGDRSGETQLPAINPIARTM